jgi:hypothetical protein
MRRKSIALSTVATLLEVIAIASAKSGSTDGTKVVRPAGGGAAADGPEQASIYGSPVTGFQVRAQRTALELQRGVLLHRPI